MDRARCLGVGACEEVSPSHFEVGDDGVLRLVGLEGLEVSGEIEIVGRAVQACPTQALSLVDEV